MKNGDLVLIKLTGEVGMLLERLDSLCDGYQKGWWVRLPDYSAVKLADFEIKERNSDRAKLDDHDVKAFIKKMQTGYDRQSSVGWD